MTHIKKKATDLSARVLAGNSDYNAMQKLKPYPPFDQKICLFLNRLSESLINHPESRNYPDIVSFAFFCRKANISHLKKQYSSTLQNRISRGLSFHIAPSNVPINFAYSLICGLLSGNACIVRTSSKDFPQTKIVCNEINQLLFNTKEFIEIKPYICIVTYQHDSTLNSFFSQICNIRLIWGGDSTVSKIREAKLPARSFDITFADRYSICLIDSNKYLKVRDKEALALKFYNDTYLFDQNACSSPRLIYWIGEDKTIEKSKQIFWRQLGKILEKKKHIVEPSIAINKYANALRVAINYQPYQPKIIKTNNNTVTRIQIKTLPNDIYNYSPPGGCFFEHSSTCLDALGTVVNNKFQTLSYIGLDPESLRDHLIKSQCSGIDRIVPCGQANHFNLFWDGYDLIKTMTRLIDSY